MKPIAGLFSAAILLFLVYCALTGYRPALVAPYWPAPVEQAAKTGRAARGNDGPVSVLAVPVKQMDVPVTVDAIGTGQAFNSVVVRSQIDGRLTQIAFQEGQDVKAGDILARIDPSTYQAQYDQALAKKAQDEALLANARMDLARYTNLAAAQYASRQQADTQVSVVAQDEAIVRGDQASIDNFKAMLDYTVIRAPIDGRAGLRAVDNGNILHAADANGLVTITQVRPIAVVFNLPQQHLRAALAASAHAPLAVTLLDADNVSELDKGKVIVIDNQVDQTTGTIKFKAEFPNHEFQLWPGQFVNVRIAVSTLPHVLVVPGVAVQRGPNGAFLYKINDDQTVTQVNIAVTRQDELNAVVAGNLSAGQLVVSSGFARLKDGAKVNVETPSEDPASPAAEATKKGSGKHKKDGAAPEAKAP
jgi:membrane fusion protein, multidrug efflux system